MGAPIDDLAQGADWAEWAESAPYSLGLEEEIMLLDPWDWALAQRIEEVLERLPATLAGFVSAETHQAAIEIATDPHADVPSAIAQMRVLRSQLTDAVARLGIAAGTAGTHPFAVWSETMVSPDGRHQLIHQTMRELARREPTFALHVHVGVPDPDSAVRLFNRLRAHVPLFLALSANSPYWQGRDSGLASTRTALFGAFPRTGIPRYYGSYEDWVATVDLLVRSGALPEPTFLWWDVRLQPKLGTVEIRIMDAQTDLQRNAALVALVQSLVRLEALEGYAGELALTSPEILDENRFLAARDGTNAALIDPQAERRIPLAESLPGLLDACRPHAEELGCADALDAVSDLVAHPNAARQLEIARRPDRLLGLVSSLADDY